MVQFITVYLLSFTVILYIGTLIINKMDDLKIYLVIILYYLAGVFCLLMIFSENMYVRLLGLFTAICLIYNLTTQGNKEENKE